MHPRDHVNARRDHGGGVDQRADRRGAFHRVRQPDVERNLRRFADGADEQQDGNDGEHARVSHRFRGHLREALEHVAEVERAERPEREQDADRESGVSQARGDEGFLAGGDGRLLQEPEANQQVAAQAHAFPPDEHHDQVRGQHQREHEEDEKVQVAEEAVVAALVRHVAGGIDVHQRADEGDHQQHDDSELVDLQRETDAEASGGEPGEIILHPGNLIGGKPGEFADQLENREKGERHRADGDGIDDGLGPVLAQEPVDRRAGKRQRHDDPQMVEYWH